MENHRNILIVGAGIAGSLLAKDITKENPLCHVVGFVDDGPRTKARPLLGKIADIPKLLSVYLVDEIVIAIPSADGALIRRILLINQKNRVPIRIVPRDQRIIGEYDVRYAEVKDLDAEDFLGRPFHIKQVERYRRFYRNKIVLVTGGAGSIGSEVVRQLIDLKVKKVVVYDNSEYLIFLLEQQLKERGVREKCDLIVGSILHDHKLSKLCATYRPDIVFHAAAYKHVHLMQDNIDEAVYNNVIGTKRVIDAAIQNKVPLFTFISTDKVVNPTSVMGATKKLAEYYISSLKSRSTVFNIVRFGNVINSRGSALPLFERQMDLYGYITVTHKKMQRYFMSIREAAQLVIESTAEGKPNAIHILDMGELIKIYDVAAALVRSKNLILGEDVEVKITGLRKGEKMIEELYTAGEKKNLRHTHIDRNILTLKNQDECPTDIGALITDLEDLVKNCSDQRILRRRLHDVFPSLKF